MNKKFTIKIMEQVFESDESGMLDLNDIWRGCGLEEKKRPSEWKSEIKQVLINSEKIRIKRGKFGGTLATEDATIAYAMFVDKNFYLLVVEAFVELRRGNITKSVEIAANTMSEADAHYLKRQAKIKGMTWAESCAFSGIYHANKCRDMLMDHPKFKYFERTSKGKFFVTEDGEDVGYFYNRGNKFTSNSTLRVTPEGREWLRNNRDWFNKATENYINTPEGLH